MRMRTAVMIAGLLLAASVLPALAQDENTWGYDKGFFFHTPRFELKISTRTQFRYTYNFMDSNSTIEDNGAFNLPRTRLRLDGYAYYTWLKYKVQYDFTGQTYSTATSLSIPDPSALPANLSVSNRRGPDLRDLYFDIARNPRATVRVGQFKAPLGIQELTSSGEQEFVDRSIASENFAPSRQQGAMLWGTSFGKKFSYDAGVFNGNARNVVTNDNPGYMYAARIHWDPSGEYKLSEAAVDHPDHPNWTIGLAYMLNTTEASLLKTAESLQQTTGEAYWGFKHKNLFALADYYKRTQEIAGGAPDVDSDGGIAQIGFFLVPRKIELALRYSILDPNKDASNDKVTESRVGFGYYFSKHELKFQSDYGQVKNEASATDEKTNRFRAQLQVVF